jgi:hypothetical protein
MRSSLSWAPAAWAGSTACDARLGREVAIKMPGSRFQARKDGHERLLQEAHAVSVLNHPNIVLLV